MKEFNDIEEIDAFLDALDFEAIWDAIEPYAIIVPDRDYFDFEIARGEMSEREALAFVKRRARTDLIAMLGLNWRLREAALSVH